MKKLTLETAIVIGIFFANLHGMKYALAPFQYTYNAGCYLLGNKTYLEIEIDSCLKTMTIPWDELTTHEKLESFLQKKIEEHLNNKAKSSSVFFAYLCTKAAYNQDALVQKIENNVNTFVSKELQKRSAISEEFIFVEDTQLKL